MMVVISNWGKEGTLQLFAGAWGLVGEDPGNHSYRQF